ncbi:MAG: hypothetical protein RBT33_00795 [Candidatus Dojkabacteria bacterium]|jgi:hypothetical protein|nr:hypothetical protein [Candidatus Dojkabacteria bacterium]MDX9738890.1 hypothetical protein [Candidatus Dojkabacteria bacterium]
MDIPYIQETDGGFKIMDMAPQLKERIRVRYADNIGVITPYLERVKLYSEEDFQDYTARLDAIDPIEDRQWIMKVQNVCNEIYGKYSHDEVICNMQ